LHFSVLWERLSPDSTVSKMEIVQNKGGRGVTRAIDFYSLDAIIAVGYRVNSKKLPCSANRRQKLDGNQERRRAHGRLSRPDSERRGRVRHVSKRADATDCAPPTDNVTEAEEAFF
jgi:hypothetical protein